MFFQFSIFFVINCNENKRLQVAYTQVHVYMWAPVPQGCQWFFCVLYIPEATFSYVTRVVAECVVWISHAV